MGIAEELLYDAVLCVLVLAGALHVLAAAGHFPREHRAAALRSKLGTAMLFASLLVMAVSILSGIIAAFRLIAWPVGNRRSAGQAFPNSENSRPSTSGRSPLFTSPNRRRRKP